MISTANQYFHLGEFSDLVQAADRQHELYQPAAPGIDTVKKVCEVLGFCAMPEEPQDVRLEYSWEKDGLIGEALSWWVGYGPRTQAWLFKPAGSTSTLPGVLALHDHGGFKYYGKEKIAVDENGASPAQLDWFASAYGGRAWVNALAKRGFVVLVHDAFLWGSRKFPLSTIRSALGNIYPSGVDIDHLEQNMDEIQLYNFWAGHHEHLVEKYCNLLGTCLAGVVSHEDRIALNYLASRQDVQTENLGCLGLSGGGNRSVLLRSTADRLKAAGVVGLMSTYPALLDRHVATHTWMFFPSGWARFGDWPDIAASRAPAPLLVQYDTEDELFTLKGMQAAHQKLLEHYTHAGDLHAYTGQFYPGAHKFDVEMQESAFQWMEKCLKSG
jgi:dienelactone hydrolase